MNGAERRRVRVRGVVQGVGFRPFVHGLATRLELSGWAANDGGGVIAEIEGDGAALEAFLAGLRKQAPPAAVVQAIEVIDVSVAGGTGFRIMPSSREPGTRTAPPPDLATCEDCLRELRDPHGRRHRHPFISCTACGPRFTIIGALPYDRERTTMASFPLCPACSAEYEDPEDRRFHAEPICCPDCGPVLRLRDPDGSPGPEGEAAILATRELLAAGGIVAIKGLGGFHLACDAADGAALTRLRAAKGREAKPFAVMAADLESAQALGHISDAEAELLASRQAPIVLLRRHEAAPVHELAAPGSPWLGLLLPYTPLHHLLFDDDAAPGPRTPVLVMTSGNRSGEPIAFRDDDALTRLGPMVDALLTHDREIAAPCDDSVLRVHAGQALPLRRSRGYAPLPVSLPVPARVPILAVGGELKAALALATGDEAFLGPHIGDVGDPAARDALGDGAEHLASLLDAEPIAFACDLHPGAHSSRWAERHAAGRPLHRVQHHHAHAASVMAEHGLTTSDEVIAVTFDGSGYGPDGTIWGGEVLAASFQGYRRLAHLAPVPLPGGELAIRTPARMALAHLWAAGLPWDADLPPVAALTEEERGAVHHQLETGLHAPLTSSVGRLFDAVAALVGVCRQARYEGEAASALEGLAADLDAAPYPVELGTGEPAVIAAAPVIAAVVQDVRAGAGAELIAARFHATVAAFAAAAARRARERLGLTTVALSGGVFQNVCLLQLTTGLLADDGFTVLAHRLVPPNDGGLALGQAAIAAAAEA